MNRGDLFVIGGKWISPTVRIQVYTFNRDDTAFFAQAEAAEGDIGVVLSVIRDQQEYSSRWINFYHVLFTNGIAGLIHRCFILKVE